MMEEVFKDEKESENSVVTINHLNFPNLKKIKLDGLPMLGSLCNVVDAVIECPSIERLEVVGVSRQKVFGRQLEQVKCTKLKVLRMRKLGIEIFYSEVPFGFFSKLEELEIVSFHSLRTLLSSVVFEVLINLRKLIVKDCMMLEDIVKIEEGKTIVGSSSSVLSIFSRLYELELSKLPKICYFCPFVSNALEFPSLGKVIIKDCQMMETFAGDKHVSSSSSGLIPARHFFGKQVTCPKLEKLDIERCHNLKSLFSYREFGGLTSLETLRVSNCSMLEWLMMKEVFNDEKESENSVATINHLKFPNLKTIKLDELPMLGSLCNAVDAVIECPSIEELDIDEVSLQKVFGSHLDQVKCTKLKVLRMRKLATEIFYSEVPFGFFSELEVLEIISFHNLRTLFSPTVFGGLINLRKLIVKDCMMLEDIVKIEEGKTIVESSSSVLSIFSGLYELELSELPKIRYFCPFMSNALEFLSLGKVIIKDCQMMETFAGDQHISSSNNGSIPARPFFGKQVTCPKLRELTLEGLKVSGLLFSPEILIAHLNALRLLQIESCHNLNNLFTTRMFGGLTSLEDLEVINCSMLEKVIGNKQDENKDVDDDDELLVVSLPKLEVLIFKELPKLCGFSHHHLELPSVEGIMIENCSEIMKSSSFCVGGGCVRRMPTGVRVEGISDPEFASQFFFHTQNHQGEEDSLGNGSFILLPADLLYIWDSENAEPSLVKGSSNAFFLDGWKKVCGKFDVEKLSPEITYEITFVIMLVQEWYAKDELLETILVDDERQHKVKDMPKQQWIEILAGPSSCQCGEITFSLQKSNWITCVALKGVIIRPKENFA